MSKLILLWKKYATAIVWGVALIAIAVVLLTYENHLLWKIQEKNLFLCSSLFFKEQMVVPGGLLTWIGTWFTQFLYYPWLGVLMLCGWWLVLLLLIKQTFQTPSRWAVMLLIPVALLLLTNVDMGYWIYMLKLRGHFFVSTIGTTMVVALLWGFRTISDKCLFRALFLVVTCALGYPLIGIYGLAATLLMGLWAWKLSEKRTHAIVLSVLPLIVIIAVPLVCYRFVYYQINLANIWWAELPLYYVTEEYHAYYIPYYLLLLFFIVMVLTYKSETPDKPKRPKLALAVQVLTAIILVAGVWHFWFKDENFHHEVKMQHQIDNLDWEGVLEEAATQECEPTRAIVMMRNLALSRLGRQGNEMFLYKNGSRRYEAPFNMSLMLVAGPLIYYQYGMLNYCNRLCIEMGVEFGFRAEDYQLLVNCAILDNDQPLARKYIDILKQTMFYSDWAKHAETLIGQADLIIKDSGREPITHMFHYKSFLGGDQGYIERFLMRQLVMSTDTSDPIFQEQCLLATLWTKDINQFWYHFYNYVRLHPNAPMPRYYQEAAYLYGKLEGRTDLNQMPFEKGIKDTFDRFMSFAQKYEGQDVEAGRQGLYPFFGETYYYDYYMMRRLPEY